MRVGQGFWPWLKKKAKPAVIFKRDRSNTNPDIFVEMFIYQVQYFGSESHEIGKEVKADTHTSTWNNDQFLFNQLEMIYKCPAVDFFLLSHQNFLKNDVVVVVN